MDNLPVVLIIAFVVITFIVFEVNRRLSMRGNLEQIIKWYEKEKENLTTEYKTKISDLIQQLSGEKETVKNNFGGSCCSTSESPEDRALERLYYLMLAANDRAKYERIQKKLGLELTNEAIKPLSPEDMRVVYVDKANEEMFLIGMFDDKTFAVKDKNNHVHDLLENEFRTPPRLEGSGIGCSCTSMADQGDIRPEHYIMLPSQLIKGKSLDDMKLLKGKTIEGDYVVEDSLGRMYRQNTINTPSTQS